MRQLTSLPWLVVWVGYAEAAYICSAFLTTILLKLEESLVLSGTQEV